MAEYSTASFDTGRYDKSAAVPQLERRQADLSYSNELMTFAKGLEGMGQSMGNMAIAQKNQAARAEAKKKADEAFARQEKTRKENEARVEAERLYTETGGGKSWQELSEEKRSKYVSEFYGPDKSRAGWNSGAAGDKRLGTWKRDQGDLRLKTVKSGKYLTKEQSQDEFLKNAYQQKRTEGVLKKQQADWDAVAPNLVDKVYDEWELQRGDKDPETGQHIGETDFTKYATAKLELYKLERAQEHFVGLPQLGEALKKVPLNDNKYLSMVALRKQGHVDELQQRNIQSGIDTHLTGDNPTTDLGSPESIDALIEHISVLGPEGSNLKGADGKVLRIHDRNAVQLQLIDDINSKLLNAESSDDPVFKLIDSFTGTNAKAGRLMYERKVVGPAWFKAVGAAMKKKSALLKQEKKATESYNKNLVTKAKENSNRVLINSGAALDYHTISHQREGEGVKIQTDEHGKTTTTGSPTKIQALLTARANLESNQEFFATGKMSKEYNEMRSNLTKAINELDPHHTEFDISKSAIGTRMKKEFISDISEYNVDQLQKERTKINQDTNAHPAVVVMKHAAIKARFDELDQDREIVKDQQAITKSDQTIQQNKNKKTSSTKTREYRSQIRDDKGQILSSKDLLNKLATIKADEEIVDEHANTLTTEFNTLIAAQQKKEHIQNDTKVHTKLFKDLTAKGTGGELKTASQWQALENKVTSHKWIEGSPQKTQLLNLISAGKNKTGDFDRLKADLIKENEYRTRLSEKLKPVEKSLTDIVGLVSLPEGAEGKITVDQALTNLEDAQKDFETKFETIIKEGGTLGINIDHSERFQDTYASILAQRTEKEISDDKKRLIKEYEKVEESREKFKTEGLNTIREITENPLQDSDGNPRTAAEAVQDIIDIFGEATHEKRTVDGVELEPTNVFSAVEQDNYLRKLQVSIKEKTDPSKRVSKAGIITRSYTLQQKAGALSGDPRTKILEENINLIETEYLKGNLSTGDFNKERGIIKELLRFGEVKTKPAFAAGENHIRSIFAGHLTKFTNNKMFLPVNEDGKLYDTLSQGFNQEFASIAESLKNAKPQEQLAKAYEIAQKYTKYYPDDNHPLGPKVNERIRRYSMDTLSLMELWKADKKRKTEEEVKNRLSGKTNPKPKAKKSSDVSEEGQESEIFKALENDTTSYIITPSTGAISVVSSGLNENPQGWASITWDAIKGIGDDTDEEYITISTPSYATSTL